jgi:tetratricopeptide (TPR) repeat protein
MKKISLVFLVTLCTVYTGLLAQTSSSKPEPKPTDAVISKFNEGAAKVNSGDFKNAISLFDELIVLAEKIGPDGNEMKLKAQTQLPLLHYRVANALINQKKYDEAIPELEKTIELCTLYNNNQPTKEKALKFLPQLLTGIGSRKIKEKDFSSAIQNFDEALKYDSSYSKAYLGKGKCCAEQFREKDMLDNLNKAIELSNALGDTTNSQKARNYIVDFYIKQGNASLAEVDTENADYSLAISSFEKAVSYDPDASDAFLMLAMICNFSSEFDKAIEYGNKALTSEKDPTKMAAINYELGNAYFNIADYTNACTCYNKVLTGSFAEKARIKKTKVPGCN